MGIMDFVKGGIRELMIARPDHLKHRLVYKHPDQNIPLYSQIAVDSDECALFFKDGQYHGRLPAGRHTLRSEDVPFLNNLIAQFTGGDIFITEIFFVRMGPILGIPFGGPLALLQDPILHEFVTPRICCELALQVTDPVRFVVAYRTQAVMDEDLTLNWIKGKFLMSVKTVIGQLCASQPKSFLDLCGMTPEISNALLQHGLNLDELGIKIADIGNLSINFSKEDLLLLRDANRERVVAGDEP